MDRYGQVNLSERSARFPVLYRLKETVRKKPRKWAIPYFCMTNGIRKPMVLRKSFLQMAAMSGSRLTRRLKLRNICITPKKRGVPACFRCSLERRVSLQKPCRALKINVSGCRRKRQWLELVVRISLYGSNRQLKSMCFVSKMQLNCTIRRLKKDMSF